MKITEVKEQLNNLQQLRFKLPDGSCVPKHFHVTEVGVTTKKFIDCGGTVRVEKAVNFQLWEADDVDHRLAPKKLLKIISLSQAILDMEGLEVEVEYQSVTIGRYGLDFDGTNFLLTPKQTDCLAKGECGIEQECCPSC